MVNNKRPTLGRLIGERLLKLRDARGWTMQEVADRLGLVQNSLSHLESREAVPNAYTLYRLSQTFGVSIDSWFEGYQGEDS
jgi:transcriptional regulator with XRE-family HTH domain